MIAPVEEVEFLIKVCNEKKAEIEKSWGTTKTVYGFQEDTIFKDYNEILKSTQNFKPASSKIHPENARPQNKRDYVVLSKDELEIVNLNTKKKLLLFRFLNFGSKEKESLLKIELMRAVEMKKKDSLLLLFDIYQKDKKHYSFYIDAKRAMKEVDEKLYDLEQQELRLTNSEKK